MSDSARFKAKEEHDHATNDSDDADPVNGFYASKKWSSWRVKVEKDKEHGKGETVKRKVDVELDRGSARV